MPFIPYTLLPAVQMTPIKFTPHDKVCLLGDVFSSQWEVGKVLIGTPSSQWVVGLRVCCRTSLYVRTVSYAREPLKFWILLHFCERDWWTLIPLLEEHGRSQMPHLNLQLES